MGSVAVVTGVAGQDGVYLARSLRADGYRVVGVAAPGSTSAMRHAPYLEGVELRSLDVRDATALADLVGGVEPDEIYNLAALSSVAASWQAPDDTFAVNLTPVETLLDAALALRERSGRDVRFFQASSAEVGGAGGASPYARSKAAAEAAVRRAREEHGLHAGCATLYNHESPLRGEQFVTRKISRGAAEMALGRRSRLELGNLEVSRDWGFAGEYVEAMRLMVRSPEPVDLALGTGVLHTLRDLVEVAFEAVGLTDGWSRVVQDESLIRPADARALVADPEPARRRIGWSARTSFERVVRHMARVDLQRLTTGVEVDEAYLDPP